MSIRYAWAIARQFRWTIGALLVAVLVGAVVHAGGDTLRLNDFFEAWMAMFAQASRPAEGDHGLQLLWGIYALFGFVLVGEGIVRLGMLIFSKEHGNKEWTRVMAQTYSDHIVLCGLGNLGFRVLGQLLAARVEVVALEKDENCRFLADAKATGTPVIVRDMKQDQALIDAGIPRAKTVIIATNDDMANLEVAMDARRMNPKIRVIMRLFDQQMADKFKGVGLIDEAFSATALAAPRVAELALGAAR